MNLIGHFFLVSSPDKCACGPFWRSGYYYLNKGECNLNQSRDDSFVEWVAKNNS